LSPSSPSSPLSQKVLRMLQSYVRARAMPRMEEVVEMNNKNHKE